VERPKLPPSAGIETHHIAFNVFVRWRTRRSRRADHDDAVGNDRRRGIVNIDLGNDSDALADLTAAIGINPDYAMAYYKRGMLQIRFRSFDNALEDFIHSIAIERRQQDANGQVEDTGRSGTRVLRNGVRQKYLDGLSSVREAIEGLGEETIPLWTRLAWAYRVLVRDAGLEIECLDRTVSVAPDNAVSFHNRAMSAIQNGQPRKALLDLNKAIALNPDLAHSYLRRAEVLADTLGDVKSAISDFRKFIELRPEAPHAKAARMRIAELGGRPV
jgi:tetratricopeptide (TPR) repeat protein